MDVKFISFEDVKAGALDAADVVISAGRAGDVWSGGDAWNDPALVSEVTRFVHQGGSLIGAGEPSAAPGGDTFLRLAHVLGVDVDDGSYACHAPWAFTPEAAPFAVYPDALVRKPGVRLTRPDTRVLCAAEGVPQLTLHAFGRGQAVYMSGFTYSPAAARMLLELLLALTGRDGAEAGISDHPLVETAWFPADGTLAALNNADAPVSATVRCPAGSVRLTLAPLETRIQKI